MRHLHFSLVFCCFFALVFSAPLLAQAPPAYPGAATAFPAYYGSEEPGPSAVWDVEGPGVSGNPPGWNVTYHAISSTSHTLTITVPANLPASSYGSYSASYVTGHVGSTDDGYFVGYSCSFQVAASPTLPAAGNPAFSWQGSVAGVNTGNGNKTTTLPITGWTMRGGMPVSCALYHNSQGAVGGTYGYKWNPSYLTSITPGPGNNVTLHWDNGLTYSSIATSGTSYTLPYGILDTLNSTGSGTFKMTTPSQTVYTFGFAPNGASGAAYLSSITDMDGNTLAINHNSDATIKSVVDPTNRALTYAYSGGHLATVTDPLNRVWTFSYVSGSYLQTIQLPPVSGQTYSLVFGYGDGRQNITAFTDARGNSSFYAYNSNNSLATAQDSVGNQTTFTYNADNTVITDPNGHATTHTYSASRLYSVTDALSYSSSTTYDYNNIVTQTMDKRGYPWTYQSHFSSGSNTSTSTDPYGYASSTSYDSKNKAVSSVDALGNTTANTYTGDSKEDLTATSVTGTGSTPFQATSKVSGYANGLPTSFTDPLGFGSSIAYDNYGNPNSATDANSHTSTAVFNILGWQTSTTDANKNSTTNTYDNWGRVTDIMAMDGTHTKMTYDPNGNVLTVTDADNHTVTNAYDADNRLTQTQNGRGDVVKYTYDGPNGYGSVDRNGVTQKGLLSSKTDGNTHVTTYAYTARNEPAATYYPDGTGESVTYDANGNSVSRTKADGKVIKYAYDGDNRLTDITYPTLHATHFDYDADGRRVDMTDATGTTSWYYAYDGVHLSQLASPQGTLTYVYDGDGRLSYKYANVTNVGVVSYWYNAYDNAGRLTSLRSTLDGTTTYAYDAADRLTQKTLGNGNYDTYAYDACDEVTSIGYYNPGGNYQNGLFYNYDPAGNRTYCNQNWYNTTYAYDGANQLVSETGGGTYAPPTLGYTYDHNGNRLTQTQNGNPFQSFTYDAHDKLTSGTAANETDHYDPNGNETSFTYNGGLYQFAFDDEDRLTGYTVPAPSGSGTVTESYVYNGLGLRVGKTDRTGSYSYLCDGATPGSPVLSDGPAIYTPGLSEYRSGVSTYTASDVLGNLWFIDNASAGQTYYQYTTAFGSGQGMGIGGSEASPFKFGGDNGCQTDVDLGLVLMGHRYYDTRIGRFLSQDPAGDGDNWYEYASNNPTNKTDPTGLSTGLPGTLGAPDQHYGGFGGGFADALNLNGSSDLTTIGDPEGVAELQQVAGWHVAQALALDAIGKIQTGANECGESSTTTEAGIEELMELEQEGYELDAGTKQAAYQGIKDWARQRGVPLTLHAGQRVFERFNSLKDVTFIWKNGTGFWMPEEGQFALWSARLQRALIWDPESQQIPTVIQRATSKGWIPSGKGFLPGGDD